jgi:hypothetical protein
VIEAAGASGPSVPFARTLVPVRLPCTETEAGEFVGLINRLSAVSSGGLCTISRPRSGSS